MRLMRQTMEEILMYRDTNICLLQHLSFILNMAKSILNSVQEINGIFIATAKDKVDSGQMPRPVCERFCHSPGADKTDSSFSFNNHSCITGTIKLSLSSTITDKCYKTQWVMPMPMFMSFHVLGQGVEGRTVAVDSKFETLQ